MIFGVSAVGRVRVDVVNVMGSVIGGEPELSYVSSDLVNQGSRKSISGGGQWNYQIESCTKKLTAARVTGLPGYLHDLTPFLNARWAASRDSREIVLQR